MLCRTDKAEDGGTDVYVGSTLQPLWKRLSTYKDRAGNPSGLKYYRGSKLYRRMREVGIGNWEIVPLLTFTCDRETIFKFEREWIKVLGANLNTVSPIDEDLVKREYHASYFKKNKETKQYYCSICDVAFMHNYDLKKNISAP